MLTLAKPLFRPELIYQHLKTFSLTTKEIEAWSKLQAWAEKLSSGSLDQDKETELLPEFLTDIFISVLGYVGRPADHYTLRREALVEVDGKFADAALGQFSAQAKRFVVVLEGKGPRDPLDRPFAGRKRSAVDQAMQYAVQLQIDWYLVTNLKEIRLFHKGHDTHTFERFELAKIAANELEYRKLVYLLKASHIATADVPLLNTLLQESAALGRDLTNEFYKDYRNLRNTLFEQLRELNPEQDSIRLLAATQKILDRVLFIAFCEDRNLLPGDIIKQAYEQRDPFNPRPVWQSFVGLFG